jgi:hypothetical protein
VFLITCFMHMFLIMISKCLSTMMLNEIKLIFTRFIIYHIHSILFYDFFDETDPHCSSYLFVLVCYGLLS